MLSPSPRTARRPAARGGRDDRGAIALMAALLATTLFVIAALVIDLGLARDVRRQSQAASDSAALAAANVLYPSSGACTSPSGGVPPCFTDAVNAAKSYSAANFGVPASAWNTCADAGKFYVPPGSTPCISFTDDTMASSLPRTPNRVRVLMPERNVAAGLGRAAGVRSIDIGSYARAKLSDGQARSCGLCLLGTSTSALGNGDVTVNGGSVFTNGSVDTGPNGHLTASPTPPNTITSVGTCVGNCVPATTRTAYPIADPYADAITLPLSKGTLTAKTDPCTQGPGIYGALTLPNSTCDLAAGVYFLTGVWDMRNNTLLRGTGVVLYGTCGTTAAPTGCAAPSQAGGGLDGKNGDTQLIAPTTSPGFGIPAGMVIIYDRTNTTLLNLQGNGNSSITGAVYAVSTQLQFPGNSYFTVTNGPVIVGSLYGNGNTGGVNLNSVNGANIPPPPSGAYLDQ